MVTARRQEDANHRGDPRSFVQLQFGVKEFVDKAAKSLETQSGILGSPRTRVEIHVMS